MSEVTTPECIGSQTVGPYYAIGLDHMLGEAMAGDAAQGDHVSIAGTIYDGEGQPVPDAILELWQARPDGIYALGQDISKRPSDAEFAGFVRLSTHEDGRFHVTTVKPGAVVYGDGRMQAPHIVGLLFMRGLMRHLVTRIYFPDDEGNADDPVLQLVPEARRHTLIAKPIANSNTALEWNIFMQGENETVFFEC